MENTARAEINAGYSNSDITEAILGVSESISNVKRFIKKVSNSDSTVLVLGESGTGKELVARALHYSSPRANKPFIPINCGAIPEDLLESELFGHEKGAFTGAIATKVGRFEAAHGGTIFLDEIGDMNPGLQVKILRVLQEREFERIGGRNTIKIDVRIIAATNKNLEAAVKEKRFREDLYYRLNVIPIYLPPLRERKGDISLLTSEFLKKLSKEKKRPPVSISSSALKLFEFHNWPGNVRELHNLLERLFVLNETGEIGIKDLPEQFKANSIISITPSTEKFHFDIDIPREGMDLNSILDSFETELICKALEISKGVKKKAAELLKIKRTTLIEKMKRKGLLSGIENEK